MVDFAKLRRMSDEERAANRADTDRRLKEARQTELRAKIKHTRVLTTTPSEDVQCRFEEFMSKNIIFDAIDEAGRPVRCHRIFDQDEGATADAFMIDLGEKPMTFTARGYFRPWTNRKTSQVVFTFIIVDIEPMTA